MECLSFALFNSIQKDNKPTPQAEVVPQQCDQLVACSLFRILGGNSARTVRSPVGHGATEHELRYSGDVCGVRRLT